MLLINVCLAARATGRVCLRVAIWVLLLPVFGITWLGLPRWCLPVIVFIDCYSWAILRFAFILAGAQLSVEAGIFALRKRCVERTERTRKNCKVASVLDSSDLQKNTELSPSEDDGVPSESRNEEASTHIHTKRAPQDRVSVISIPKLCILEPGQAADRSCVWQQSDDQSQITLSHRNGNNSDCVRTERIQFDQGFEDFSTMDEEKHPNIGNLVDCFLSGSTVCIVAEGGPNTNKADTLFTSAHALLPSTMRYLASRGQQRVPQLQLRVVEIDNRGVYDLIAEKVRPLISPGSLQQLLTRFEVESVDVLDPGFEGWWNTLYARRSGMYSCSDSTSHFMVILSTHFPTANVMVFLDQPTCVPLIGHSEPYLGRALMNQGLEASHRLFCTLSDASLSIDVQPSIWSFLTTLLPASQDTRVAVILHLLPVYYSSNRYLLAYKRDLEHGREQEAGVITPRERKVS